MRRSFALLVVTTAVLITAFGGSAWWGLQPGGLPFSVRFADEHTAVVVPIKGIDLPAGLRDGDAIDLPALDPMLRATIWVAATTTNNARAGHAYTLKVRRGGTDVDVPISTVDLSAAPVENLNWVYLYVQGLFSIVGLLALWRGRDDAARYLAVWGLAYVGGYLCRKLPLSDTALIAGTAAQWVCFFVGRYGLYRSAESLAGGTLSRRTRSMLRIGLAVTMTLGMGIALGGGWLLIAKSSAAILFPEFTWLITSPYLMPAAALVIAYQHTAGVQKIRVRWMLWSLVPFFTAILARDVSFGFSATFLIDAIGISLGLTGILYAILRHRVVDVSIVIDRALVYGLVTTLVVGLLAAVNSLALRLALPPGAGLVLQLIVPLSLGIVLGRVRSYVDRLVERVFFRGKYLTEKALRRFVRRCAHIEEVPKLLDAAVTELRRHTRAPAVAFYEVADGGLRRLRQAGERAYPAELDKDDDAVVEIRAERKAVDLAGIESDLGAEGVVFPIIVLGTLRGLVVLADRPGERYAADERKLLYRVVRDVGAAWRILRARDNEELVRSLAKGTLKPTAARARAKALEAAWTGA